MKADHIEFQWLFQGNEASGGLGEGGSPAGSITDTVGENHLNQEGMTFNDGVKTVVRRRKRPWKAYEHEPLGDLGRLPQGGVGRQYGDHCIGGHDRKTLIRSP
jgi:hypothetical protein